MRIKNGFSMNEEEQNMFDKIMSFDKENQEVFNKLVALSKQGHIIPYICAGLSYFAKLPGWEEFLDEIWRNIIIIN